MEWIIREMYVLKSPLPADCFYEANLSKNISVVISKSGILELAWNFYNASVKIQKISTIADENFDRMQVWNRGHAYERKNFDC